jgi:acetoin utilization protein AcuB
MLMPPVSRFMTREPYTVAPGVSLSVARELMNLHRIRHLPVVEGRQIVGIVGQSEVRTLEAIPGVDLRHVEIAKVMQAPSWVWSETPLDEVAQLMSAERRECVVVLGGHGVEGIFTATDALLALNALLQRATA